MTALQDVEWEACLLEPQRDAALERFVRDEMGGVPPIVPYFAVCPWVVRSLMAINQYRVRLVHVSFALADLIGLVVSQENSCRFCYATQRVLLRAQGLPEGRIPQLEDDFAAARLDPRERSALEFARRIARCSPRPSAADRAALGQAGWSAEAVGELAFVAAAHVYFNLVATIPALPVARLERMSRTWWLGLLAPLFGRRLRAHQVRGDRQALPPQPATAPFAGLVQALDGLPAALSLRRVLDEAWQSPALPARAKALVFAVVARGVGCPRSELEARRLLQALDMDAAAVEETLAHLGSPALSALESLAVPFARETVRYRPIQVQRRARQLAGALDRTQLVELIAISALANAVSRLCLALESP
jgi:alkylhydroperoxidase family enzyme